MAQAGDFIVLKKNGRTVRSIFKGSTISFQARNGNYSGVVETIQHDSIFLIQYDVRQMPTRLGVYVLDTVAVYRSAVNFHEVNYIDKDRYGFSWRSAGATLFGTGSLLTVLGAGSWLVTKKDSRYYARPGFVAGTAILAGIGYALLKLNTNDYKIGRKYSLDYIRIK